MFYFGPGRREKGSTALAQVDPFRLINEEFENLFGKVFGPSPMAGLSNWWNGFRAWGVDVSDKEQEVVVRAELPGFDAKDIDVSVSENVLTIEAEHGRFERKSDSHDRQFRGFRRAFNLPSGLDTEKVEATYRNGVLEVRVPRLPQAQPRKVEIKS